MAGSSVSIVRNVGIYIGGVATTVIGALGIAEAVAIPSVLAAALFVLGLLIVLAVHEFLGGPV